MTEQKWYEGATPSGRGRLPVWLMMFLAPVLAPLYAVREDRVAQYRPAPDHVVTFPPGPGGRPGFTVRSFSRSVQRPQSDASGMQWLGALHLTERRDRMILTCRGRVSSVGSSQAALARAVAELEESGWRHGAPMVADFGFGPVHAVWGQFPRGLALTELRFERGGWVFGVGVCAFSHVAHLQAHTEAVLRSWTWLEAAADPSGRTVSPAGPR